MITTRRPYDWAPAICLVALVLLASIVASCMCEVVLP